MRGESYAPTVKATRGKGPRTKAAARRRRMREEARRTTTSKVRGPFYERS